MRLQERGESFYNQRLEGILASLKEKCLLTESQGAQCIFMDEWSNAEGQRLPLIVQKSDGGFLYATTDLAAVQQRCASPAEGGEGAERVLYVTDVGQAQHFAMVFKAAHAAAFTATDRQTEIGTSVHQASLEHVPFGLVQGEDGKKFKTRSGDTVKLKDLLDEAVTKAEADLTARLTDRGDIRPGNALSLEQKQAARAIGIAAVKYADLSMNRESNYRFSYSKVRSSEVPVHPSSIYMYIFILPS